MMGMSEIIHDLNAVLQKINKIERELKELKIMVLKMIAENLPEEEIDKETLEALKKDLENMKTGKIKGLSAEEFIRMLSESLDRD
ncbi:hypothetical protein TBCH5v1_0051 [Thermococcus barophilus]|uniref:Uncharacterized protein n=2 Tax=Thermococcus barophilus TaxID=55802 RepID=A0A0S1X8J8_THEBA|nr:hypothetical protein TBCH5v1_0051 [Thermococcus barophilus]